MMTNFFYLNRVPLNCCPLTFGVEWFTLLGFPFVLKLYLSNAIRFKWPTPKPLKFIGKGFVGLGCDILTPHTVSMCMSRAYSTCFALNGIWLFSFFPGAKTDFFTYQLILYASCQQVKSKVWAFNKEVLKHNKRNKNRTFLSADK